ncbi:lipoprotein signal peptidase [Neisseria shayeganii]|uniref:lipoprotein signal peptidase n=1 Tax=Neisseria shayeganii TaxID=607712 RepID=UPI000A069DF8|nr:lipoprotein signal peptidase [Neisseria shayeganii]
MLWSGRISGLRPLQNPHLRRISALCVYALWVLLAVLLRLELHPHLGVLQRSQAYAPVVTRSF